MTVPIADIGACFDRAVSAGCTPAQPVTEMPDMGMSSAMLAEPLGYIGMPA